jgi:hypothetical protein
VIHIDLSFRRRSDGEETNRVRIPSILVHSVLYWMDFCPGVGVGGEGTVRRSFA